MQKTLLFLLFLTNIVLTAQNTKQENTFVISQPNYEISPHTGMIRQHWVDAATYLLDGAFSYVNTLEDPMIFPKQHDKTYPHNDRQVVTEKLEGLCRTLFVAAPLLKENPDLTLNNIKVADYYRHHILNLIRPENPEYVRPRTGKSGGGQTLVEFGALAISLSLIPEIIWEPLSQDQKDSLAETMISYGNGPTVDSNWRFFNIFVLSFFKDKGYSSVKEEVLLENIERALAFYRGKGWYNDAPAYDYYSMWAFQLYGPVWAKLYGERFYPDLAQKFMDNFTELPDSYPYMFNRSGKMNMWGRSIAYRFGAIAPLALTAYLDNRDINYGWMRHISSSTLLQFLQNPDFLEESVPTLGFYKAFAPSTQIYSCRGSVYWCGKAFLPLILLPSEHPFWTDVENNKPWQEMQKGHVYNRFQDGSNLLITDYPNSGAAEMRSWCHEPVAKDWQKFRSTENYNKLAYNTEFPWMADGKNGEISMNYGVKNEKGEWEVLRLYTFKSFENGIYRRDAVLETNSEIKWQLADIPLPDGILRVDKVSTPIAADIRLGHYSLPELSSSIQTNVRQINKTSVNTISNGEYQLAMIPLDGWKNTTVVYTDSLHPISDRCAVIIASDQIEGEKIYITLQLWKKGERKFSKKELSPVKNVKISEDKKTVEITLSDKTKKIIEF